MVDPRLMRSFGVKWPRIFPWHYLIPGRVAAIKKSREEAGHDFIRIYSSYLKERKSA